MDSHYVPQMYLKGWQAGSGAPKKHNWVYEKNVLPKLNPYKKHAIKPDYYTDRTEKWLDKEIENKTAEIFVKLGNQKTLTSEEKLQLARFIFVMWNRVPSNIDGIGKTIEDLLIADQLRFLTSWKKHLGNLYDSIELIIRHPAMRKLTYSEMVERDNYGQSEKIANMKWWFLRAAPGMEFVTSDNPFCYSRDIGIGAGSNNPRSVFFGYFLFPIDKNTVLIATNIIQSGKDFKECSEDRVRHINRVIISNAQHQVYASIMSNELEEMVNIFIGKELEIKPKVNIINRPKFPKSGRF